MDRSVQKRFLVKAVVAAAAMVGLVTHANAVALTPGKWRSDYRVQVNGKDSTATMAQFAAQMRASMPTQLKSTASVSLNSIGNLGSATACMAPDVTSKLTSPRLVFNLFAKMNPRCTLFSGPATATSVTFTGRCDDPFSYTGNVSGQVNVPNSSSWDVSIAGVGRFPDALLAAMNLPAKSLVPMKTTAKTVLLSQTCP